MDVFAENRERIDDIPFLVDLIWEKLYHHFPEKLRVLIRPGLIEAVDGKIEVLIDGGIRRGHNRS